MENYEHQPPWSQVVRGLEQLARSCGFKDLRELKAVVLTHRAMREEPREERRG